MFIWLAWTIPIVAAVLLFIFYRSDVVWWEYLILLLVPLCLIGISKLVVDTVQVQDTEYWGGWVTEARYFEPWNEEVEHSDPVYDSKGNIVGYSHYTTIDEHPPRWEVAGSNGEEIGVNEATYQKLVKQFKNTTKIELNRHYYVNDGDEFVAKYTGDLNTLEPLTTIHQYENRTQSADTVYKYPEVPKKKAAELGLFEYPDISNYYYAPTVMGYSSQIATCQTLFTRLNAELGASKQVRVWVLIFKNKPLSIATQQEFYWKGGNKNELVICIGTDGKEKIQWTRVFSWTEKTAIKVKTRDFINKSDKLNLAELAVWLKPEIKSEWKRKRFRDFSYLTVDPPLGASITVWILTIIVTAIISYIVVTNEEGNYNEYWR